MISKKSKESIEEREIKELYDNWFKKHIHHVPKKYLTKKYILRDNEYGISILHLAAQSGQLDQVPKEFLTQEHLTKVNSNGRSVISNAADKNNFHQIPKDLWTKENLTKYSNPPVIIDLAMSGGLGILPDHLLTHEILSTQDSLKNNAYIISARNGTFEQIPKRLVNKDVLLQKDNNSLTVLDHIATTGKLNIIDSKWINGQTLLNNNESPVLDSVAIYCLDNNCTKQLKSVVKKLTNPELKEVSKKQRYPENIMEIIDNEIKRKTALEIIHKKINKKVIQLDIDS